MTKPITKSRASPNRHGSIRDALREELGFEKEFLGNSLLRSILLFALLPFVRAMVGPWGGDAAQVYAAMILFGAPVALFILLGWSDEFFPL